MFKNSQSKYSITFNKGEIYEIIRRYLTVCDNMNHVIGSHFKAESNEIDGVISKEYKLNVKAPYGNYPITFNEQEIWIDYRISDRIVGSQNGASVLEILVISTNKDKQVLYDFVEAARKYSEVPKPDPMDPFTTITQFDVDVMKWIKLSQLKKEK